jgi:hypothetical protein
MSGTSYSSGSAKASSMSESSASSSASSSGGSDGSGDSYGEQTNICLRFNDSAIGPQDITLTGSLAAGSFTGIYDEGGVNYTVTVAWNPATASWQITYNGSLLVTLPPPIFQEATYTNDNQRFNPIGLTLYYEDSVIIVEAEILAFGPCPSSSSSDSSSGSGSSGSGGSGSGSGGSGSGSGSGSGCGEIPFLCVVLSINGALPPEAGTLVGNLGAGFFGSVEFPYIPTTIPVAIYWDGTEWLADIGSEVGISATAYNPCDPSDSSGPSPSIFPYDNGGQLIITPSADCVCEYEITSVCVRRYWWDGADNWEDLTLIGSLNEGSFTDTFHTLEWDDVNNRWDMLRENLSTTNWFDASSRCSPIGATISDATSNAPPEEFFVASVGDCTECSPEQTTLCVYVTTYDGVNFTDGYYELTGSLIEGYFTNGITSLWWDGLQWVAYYDGTETSDDYWSGDRTLRCDPSGIIFYPAGYTGGGPPESFSIYVENFGACLCPCAPIVHSVTLGIDYITSTVSYELIGDACLGTFTGGDLLNYDSLTLEWNGTEWTLSSANEGLLTALEASTNQCIPTGVYENSGESPYTYTVSLPP